MAQEKDNPSNVKEAPVRKAVETSAETVQASADTFKRTAEQSVEQFSAVFSQSAKVSEEAAQQTGHNLEVILQCSSVLADGLQAAMREWVGYTQNATQKGVNSLNDMFKVRTLQDALSVHNRYIQDEMYALLNAGAKISEISAQSAKEAVRRMGERGAGARPAGSEGRQRQQQA